MGYGLKSETKMVSIFLSNKGKTPEKKGIFREVFKKIKETSGDKLDVDLKGDPEKIRTYFKKLIPDYDEEKVYASEIKKMLNWYEALKDKIDFSKEEEETEDSKIPGNVDHEKPIPKIHEAHGPKAEHAKSSTARTRKKV